jgi:OPA family glycerol-3-phosphate transporter-like MFS transporter
MAGIIFYFVARDNPSDFGYELEAEEAEKERPSGAENESSRDRYIAILKNAKIHIGGMALGFQNAARYG